MVDTRRVRWTFTLNNWTEEDYALLAEFASETRYAIIGKEIAPGTGTPHLQGFFRLRQRMSMQAIKNIIG